MAYTIIECENQAHLDAYRASEGFQQQLAQDFVEPKISASTKHHVEVDAGRTGTLHCLIIEDNSPHDNVTLRLEDDGLHFWSTGVEI